jgi:hypothetical protein
MMYFNEKNFHLSEGPFIFYNVFQLPTGNPSPPPLCRLARPARWRFEYSVTGNIMYRIYALLLKQNENIKQHKSITEGPFLKFLIKKNQKR